MRRVLQGTLVLGIYCALYSLHAIAAQVCAFREQWSREVLFDFPSRVIVEANGNVFRFGSKLVKYDADGKTLWEYAGTIWNGAEVGSDGDLLVSSKDRSVVNGAEVWRVKLARLSGESGAVLWEKLIDRSFPRTADNNLVLDHRGNVFVITASYILKYSTQDGEHLWEKEFPTRDLLRAFAVGGNGEIALTSHASENGGLWVAKLDGESGAVLWETISPMGEWAEGKHSVRSLIDAAGDVFVTGTGYGGMTRIFTSRFRGTDGALVWERWWPEVNEPLEAFGLWVGNTDNSDVLVVSEVLDAEIAFDGSQEFGRVARYSGGDGTVIWEKVLTGSFLELPILRDVVSDGGGNIILGLNQHSSEWETFGVRLIKVDVNAGTILGETRALNTDFVSLSCVEDQVALGGGQVTRIYNLGPEITTRIVGIGEVGLEWAAENLGWSLQRLGGGLGNVGSVEWVTVEGSTATNVVRVPAGNGEAGIFRLVRE